MIINTEFGIKVDDNLLVRIEEMIELKALGHQEVKNPGAFTESKGFYILEPRKNLAVRVSLIQNKGSVRSKLTPESVFAMRECKGRFDPVVTVSKIVESHPSRVAIMNPSGELVCTHSLKSYRSLAEFEEDALEDLVMNSRRILH